MGEHQNTNGAVDNPSDAFLPDRRTPGERSTKPATDIADRLAAIETWIVDGLPECNRALLHFESTPEEFAVELQRRLQPLLEVSLLDLSRVERNQGRKALVMLAFCACSIER